MRLSQSGCVRRFCVPYLPVGKTANFESAWYGRIDLKEEKYNGYHSSVPLGLQEASLLQHRRDGRFNERLGFYNPMIAEGPQRLTFNEERVAHWVKNGAQMSDTVARILKGAKKAAA